MKRIIFLSPLRLTIVVYITNTRFPALLTAFVLIFQRLCLDSCLIPTIKGVGVTLAKLLVKRWLGIAQRLPPP
jgi:hypothetical protein